MSNISIIIQREFNERVRKKSFIITTLLMPVLMIALMAAPALIMQFSRGDEKVIAVIDESGLIAPKLESDEEIRFETTELPTEEARRELTEKFGVLWIGGDILGTVDFVDQAKPPVRCFMNHPVMTFGEEPGVTAAE